MTQALNPDGKLQTLKVDVEGALMVSGISGGPGGGGTSNTTEATQLLVKAAVQSIDTDLGAAGDAAATSDAGTFSLIALVKRGLVNWTTLLARIPALVSGKLPVTDPSTLPLPAGAATSAKQDVATSRMSRFAGLALWQADDQGAGTAYVQYRNVLDAPVSWYIVRYVTVSGVTAATYAGPANNTGQASATTAWASRATLVYGAPFEA